jgi:hypothetical protein
MTEMNAIEDADREKNGARQVRQIGDGMKRSHKQNDESRMTNDERNPNDETQTILRALRFRPS